MQWHEERPGGKPGSTTCSLQQGCVSWIFEVKKKGEGQNSYTKFRVNC